MNLIFFLIVATAFGVTAVRQLLWTGPAAGVTGTPTFFIGPLDAAGKSIRAGNVITGAQPYRVFQRALDRLLAAQG